MRPGHPANDIRYRPLTYPEYVRRSSLGCATSHHGSDLWHIGFGELCEVVLRPLRWGASAALGLVPHVFGSRAELKVVRVDAGWVVALVANDCPCRDGAVRLFPCDSVRRKDIVRAHRDSPVAIPVDAPDPDAAITIIHGQSREALLGGAIPHSQRIAMSIPPGVVLLAVAVSEPFPVAFFN